MRLYEAHLPVADTARSARFYEEVVGLSPAHRDRTRDIVFMWAGPGRSHMIGLWGPSTARGPAKMPGRHHVAFSVSLDELLAVGARLNSQGIVTRDFDGAETTEPSVIGWMPSAQLYFADPDGHALEYIALLEDAPDAEFIGPLRARRARASAGLRANDSLSRCKS